MLNALKLQRFYWNGLSAALVTEQVGVLGDAVGRNAPFSANSGHGSYAEAGSGAAVGILNAFLAEVAKSG